MAVLSLCPKGCVSFLDAEPVCLEVLVVIDTTVTERDGFNVLCVEDTDSDFTNSTLFPVTVQTILGLRSFWRAAVSFNRMHTKIASFSTCFYNAAGIIDTYIGRGLLRPISLGRQAIFRSKGGSRWSMAMFLTLFKYAGENVESIGKSKWVDQVEGYLLWYMQSYESL